MDAAQAFGRSDSADPAAASLNAKLSTWMLDLDDDEGSIHMSQNRKCQHQITFSLALQKAWAQSAEMVPQEFQRHVRLRLQTSRMMSPPHLQQPAAMCL